MSVALRYADGIDDLRQDFVPRSDYWGADVPLLERERLWPKVWQMACREEEIPNIGDYVVYDIADESFLIVRTGEDEITGYYNVCTHRGRRLKTDRRGHLAGGISCPFHAWRFDLEGKVKNIPNSESWDGCSELDPAKLSLVRPRVDRFAGWVWLNMDENAPPLLSALAPAAQTLDNFELEDARIVFYQTLHMPVDWKFVLEAFIEGYHTLGTHPQMMRYGELFWDGELEQGVNTSHTITVKSTPTNMDSRERFYQMIVELNETLHGMFLEPGVAAAGRVRELPEGSTAEDVANAYWAFHREELERRGAKWPEKLAAEHTHATMWHLFPNVSILPTIDGAFCYRMRPDPANERHSILDVWCLGRFAPGAEPVVEHEVYPDLASYKGKNPFLEQDFANLLAVDRGTRSRAWQGGNLNPREETTVYHFHKNLRSYMTAEG